MEKRLTQLNNDMYYLLNIYDVPCTLHILSLLFKETLQSCREGNGYSKTMSNFYKFTSPQGVEPCSKLSSVWSQSLYSFHWTVQISLPWGSLPIHLRSCTPSGAPRSPDHLQNMFKKQRTGIFQNNLKLTGLMAHRLDLLELCCGLNGFPRTRSCGVPNMERACQVWAHPKSAPKIIK